MKKKIWMILSDKEIVSDIKFSFEVELDKPIVFQELNTPSGKRTGFRQLKKTWFGLWSDK